MAVTQIVTRQLKDSAVTSAKIADAAVTLAKLGALTTKGDILGYSTTHARLAVGADGTFLKADSSQATGLVWAAFSGLTTTNFVTSEVPSGTVDGSNTNFTLANTPTAGTVKVYVNGVRMNPGSGNDYTISGNTLTFLTGAIPTTGDVLLADYMK